MNGPRIEEVVHHQAKAGWCQRCCDCGSTLRIKQPCVLVAIWHGGETALGYCHAIQHAQQRGLTRLLALYERKERVDIFGCFTQGQDGLDRARHYCSDGSGAIAQQSKLVRTHLAGSGQSRRAGNIYSGVAKGCLCTLEAKRRCKVKAKATPEKCHDVLSVGRTNGQPNKAVHRTRNMAHISVHRTYRGHFSPFSVSVHRTPSSNTTPCMKWRSMRTQ